MCSSFPINICNSSPIFGFLARSKLSNPKRRVKDTYYKFFERRQNKKQTLTAFLKTLPWEAKQFNSKYKLLLRKHLYLLSKSWNRTHFSSYQQNQHNSFPEYSVIHTPYALILSLQIEKHKLAPCQLVFQNKSTF